MDNEKMGQFIAELRKANHMTQRELAGKLNITDKAVSKWERGLSCPDIALLGPLSEALGITTGELLSGEKSGDSEAFNKMEESIDHALQYADQTTRIRVKSIRSVFSAVFSAALLIGAVVCGVCDVAVTGDFTWSLYPVLSIAFGWSVLFPMIRFGSKGIKRSLAALSILMIPFLYGVGLLTGYADLILAIGVPVTGISLVYLWGLYAAFKIWRHRMLLVGASFLLLAVPLEILVSWCVSRVVAGPAMDMGDVLSVFLMAVFGIVLLFVDIRRQRKANG